MKDGKRMVFTGPRDALLEDLAAFETAGLEVLVPALSAPSAPEMIERCEAFAEAMDMGTH